MQDGGKRNLDLDQACARARPIVFNNAKLSAHTPLSFSRGCHPNANVSSIIDINTQSSCPSNRHVNPPLKTPDRTRFKINKNAILFTSSSLSFVSFSIQLFVSIFFFCYISYDPFDCLRTIMFFFFILFFFLFLVFSNQILNQVSNC